MSSNSGTAMKKPIYLDYSATTPVDPRVAAKMIPYLTEHFGNPASRSHSFGWETEKAAEEAREEVARLVNCDPKELVWTSGATEAINLAVKGAAHFYKGKGRHLVTVKTEHKATLDTMRELEREGFEVTYLDVAPDGLLDLGRLEAALRKDTSVVSVMSVNNEIGVIQDIAAIGDMERRVPHNLNVSFNFVEGESLIMAIKDVAVSSGSACTSASLEPSYVLRALGRSDELAHSSIRFTVGRFTTDEEIDYTIGLVKRKIAKLRELSPLWEMHKEGVDLDSVVWAQH